MLAWMIHDAAFCRSYQVNDLTRGDVMKRETLAIVKFLLNRLVKISHWLVQQDVRIPFDSSVRKQLHKDPISSSADSYASIHQTAKPSDIRSVSG
jgi:hypothetical protein